jgi:hypothetical protein
MADERQKQYRFVHEFFMLSRISMLQGFEPLEFGFSGNTVCRGSNTVLDDFRRRTRLHPQKYRKYL